MNRIRIFKTPMAVLITVMLAGCTGSSVVKTDPPVSGTAPLTSIRVLWMNTGYHLGIEKWAGLYDSHQIGDEDRARARRDVHEMLSVFKRSVGDKVGKQLQLNGVDTGSDAVLRITPVDVEVSLGKERYLTLQASVIETTRFSFFRETQPVLWSTTIQVYGHLLSDNETLVDKFVDTLIGELKKGGLLNLRRKTVPSEKINI
jgi:hypothetical protein